MAIHNVKDHLVEMEMIRDRDLQNFHMPTFKDPLEEIKLCRTSWR